MGEAMLPVIVLAAGSSSRLGYPKQLLTLQNETLLHKTVRHALESTCGPVVVVVGSNHAAIASAIKDLPVDVVFNPEWNTGMGSSIKAGIRHVISQYPKYAGLLLSVCDQPYLSTDHFIALVNAFTTGQSLVVSHYGEAYGVPVLFEKKFTDELLALPDEEGAKAVIQQHVDETYWITFSKGHIDLDTSEAVMALGLHYTATSSDTTENPAF